MLTCPSIRSFRSFSPRSDIEDRGQLYTVGGNMGLIVSATEALGAEALAAEALAIEDALAAEALATEEALDTE